jgi:hypothetical protein
MLRLTHNHRTRVSNRMAVFAAFLLIAATVASLGGALDGHREAGPSMVGTGTAEADSGQGNAVSAVRSNKRFKVNLYLFRRN